MGGAVNWNLLYADWGSGVKSGFPGREPHMYWRQLLQEPSPEVVLLESPIGYTNVTQRISRLWRQPRHGCTIGVDILAGGGSPDPDFSGEHTTEHRIHWITTVKRQRRVCMSRSCRGRRTAAGRERPGMEGGTDWLPRGFETPRSNHMP